MVDRLFAFAVGTVMVSAMPAAAQDNATPAVVRDVAKCRSIAAAEARLACFDAASAKLAAAVERKDVAILDREGVRKTKRSLFGFSFPKIDLFGSRDDEPEFTEINGTIRRIVPDRGGLYLFVLDDGAQWRTTEGLRVSPRTGDPIRIRRAALGSYMINVRGSRGVKGIRVG